MQDQGQIFDEIAEIMDSRGMEINQATLVAGLMRKPARAKAIKEWLSSHPKASDKEVWDQAVKIAQTVEPTHHGTPRK